MSRILSFLLLLGAIALPARAELSLAPVFGDGMVLQRDEPLPIWGKATPAAEISADGSTTVYFGPTKPDGVNAGNWIQTDPKKGWFTILRLYSPLEPFFTKAWRPSEIQLER